jgi:hypothetical protein
VAAFSLPAAHTAYAVATAGEGTGGGNVLQFRCGQAADVFRLLSLEPLVRMKLTSFRLKDQVHLQDMIDVGLIDSSWLPKLSPELALRLKQVLDMPRD